MSAPLSTAARPRSDVGYVGVSFTMSGGRDPPDGRDHTRGSVGSHPKTRPPFSVLEEMFSSSCRDALGRREDYGPLPRNSSTVSQRRGDDGGVEPSERRDFLRRRPYSALAGRWREHSGGIRRAGGRVSLAGSRKGPSRRSRRAGPRSR